MCIMRDACVNIMAHARLAWDAFWPRATLTPGVVVIGVAF